MRTIQIAAARHTNWGLGETLRVVGRSMKAERDATMVIDALVMAVWQRVMVGFLMDYSEHGLRYTSDQFQRLRGESGITSSVSRAGNVWDNSAIESFFLSFNRSLK